MGTGGAGPYRTNGSNLSTNGAMFANRSKAGQRCSGKQAGRATLFEALSLLDLQTRNLVEGDEKMKAISR